MKATQVFEQASDSEESAVDISSLIDVCFLLLIFFLVTATIMPRESDLEMQLPKPGVSAPIEDLVMRVSVDASGTVGLGQDTGVTDLLDSDVSQRELPQLKECIQLMQIAAAPHKLLVQVAVEDESSHQRFIDVMNCLSEMGVEQVSLVDTARL